jgi:hypothetical protein
VYEIAIRRHKKASGIVVVPGRHAAESMIVEAIIWNALAPFPSNQQRKTTSSTPYQGQIEKRKCVDRAQRGKQLKVSRGVEDG